MVFFVSLLSMMFVMFIVIGVLVGAVYVFFGIATLLEIYVGEWAVFIYIAAVVLSPLAAAMHFSQ